MRTVFIVLACTVALAASGSAQQKPAAPAPEKPAAAPAAEAAKPLVPVKVQLVLSRFKGEKKISSLPYMLGVAANERAWTNVRMGIEVPIGRKGDVLTPGGGISYRSVGTNIDCMADSTAEGPFRVAIRVEDSSVLAEPSKGTTDSTPIAGDMPAFRSFKANFTMLLRDGQSTQYTSAIDPVSGEIMKIDVTLNVIK